jgi:methionyl-tRNA formyltransferase
VNDQRRLVVLTGNGPEHRYVANRLCDAVPVEAVVVDVSERARSLRRAFRGGFRRGVSRVLLELFQRAVGDRAAHDAALRKVLDRELTSRFLAEDRIVEVRGVNSPEALAAVARFRPDALLVYGTSIVHDEMLGQARDVAFNMHTGISPHYRGTHCAFWPVVNREPERIGATVHECTAEVDGGRIFAAEAAECEPRDGLHEVFARAVAKGTDLYVETVRRYLAGDLRGEQQDLSLGREYRGYMRTLVPELRARWALRRGLLRRTADRGSSPRYETRTAP